MSSEQKEPLSPSHFTSYLSPIEEITDYINTFDNKNIGVAFLLSIGRSGSNLLMSFLDSHKEILLIPTKIYYYFDWSFIQQFIGYPEQLAYNLVYYSSFTMHWFNENLGENRDEIYVPPEKEIAVLLAEVLKNLNTITRKNIFLALHFVYAKVCGFDLSKIKAIFQHHHFFISSFGYNLVHDKLAVDYSNDLEFFKMALEDFPNLKLIYTLRNPFDNYYSGLKSVKQPNGEIDLNLFYYNLYGLLLGSYSSLRQKEIIGERLKFIKYEDLHTNTEKVISELISFLNISYSDTLKKSTIAGKLWWGNNPKTIIQGTDPSLINDNWKKNTDKQSKILCSRLLNKLALIFNYETIENVPGNPDVFIMDEFKSYIISHFREINDLVSFSDIYLSLRNSLNDYYINDIENKKESKIFLELDKPFEYRGVNLYIRKVIPADYTPPEDGYFITLQSWKYYSLPIYLIDLLNKKADKIWTTSSYTRDGYVFSGINPERTEIIHYGVDVSIFNPNKPPEKLKTEKSFKFVFNGSFTNNEMFELLLEAYLDEFRENEDVCLVVRNSDADDASRNKGTGNLNNYYSHIMKHNKIYSLLKELRLKEGIPEIVFFDKITFRKTDEEIAGLFCSCNCFVYPYKTESTGKNILEAMSCGLPVITTYGGPSSDFCNNTNSYLIKSTWKKKPSGTIQNIKLVGDIHYFEPEKQHLKVLMRYVFNNKEKARQKGIQGIETVLQNFTLEHTLQKIDQSIDDLKSKSVFRFNR